MKKYIFVSVLSVIILFSGLFLGVPRVFAVPIVGPTVLITSPLGGSTTAGSGVINYSTGNPDNIDNVVCTLDGVVIECNFNGPLSFGPLSNGEHTFIVQAVDLLGNTGNASVTWNVDAIPPVITLLGVTPVNLNVGDAYSDAGAIAFDGETDLTGSIITTVTPVPFSTDSGGVFTFHYNVFDAYGNPALEVTRTVGVTEIFINPPTPVVHISASPLIITEGETSVVTYSVENVDGCTKAGDWSGGTEGFGSDTVGPLSAGSYTYILNCSGAPGTHRGASNSVTVTVNPMPQGSGPLLTENPPNQNPPTGGNGNDQTPPSGGNGNDNSGNGSGGKVLGAQTYQFVRTLRLGMKGDDVLALHKKLAELGFYKGPIDNSFGLLLQAAVKAFQKANPPLKIDGIVGPKTRAVLNK